MLPILSLIVIILIIPAQASAQTLDEYLWETADVHVEGGKFSEVDVTLRYKIDDAVLEQNAMKLNPYFYSLSLDISANAFGTVVLELPRYIFDSKMPDGVTDKPFTATAHRGQNRSEIEVRELETTEDKRVIAIDFAVLKQDPPSHISVHGTHVLPDLGIFPPPSTEPWKTVDVDVVGHSSLDDLTLRYKIRNAELASDVVRVNPFFYSLSLGINSTTHGTMTLELPRNVFDSKMPDGETDAPFTTNLYARHSEMGIRELVATEDKRVILIDLPVTRPTSSSSYNVSIQGTHVIPEFGAIAPIVLGVSMVGVLAVATRFKRL